jgi:hypothetical protein
LEEKSDTIPSTRLLSSGWNSNEVNDDHDYEDPNNEEANGKKINT